MALLWPRSSAADAVTDWNANAGRAALAACISPGDDPLHESRMYAMMHVAIHDALNAIDRRSRPYAFDAQVLLQRRQRPPSPRRRERARLRYQPDSFPFPPACLQAGIASVETDYAAALAAIPDGAAKTDGIQVGQAAAATILAMRASDGSDTPLLDFAYPQGTRPGEYRFTPGFDFAFAPGWGDVTPFVLQRRQSVSRNAPYNITSQKYTADFNEVKALGGDDITTPSARTR